MRGWFERLFKKDFEKAFDIELRRSSEMESAIQTWMELEGCNGLAPSWVKDDIRTIRFSNTVSRELAKLIVMETDVKLDPAFGGREKADLMQRKIDQTLLSILPDNLERMMRLGGMMAKWNGEGIEFVPPDRFAVTAYDSAKNITGAVFFSYQQKNTGTADYKKIKYYTKAEWHRFEDVKRKNEAGEIEAVRVYKISNKAFLSDNRDEIGREIPLSSSPWSDLEKEFQLEGMEKPLFAYLKCPYSNTVDAESPLGVSLFSECIEELRWLDIAMSTLGIETEDSKPIMFVDESALTYARNQGINLPKFVKGLQNGISVDGTIQQWQPQLQIQSRKEGINFYLNIICMKIGMDQGAFVFDGQRITMATATQVEASERKTVNTVKSFRNLLDMPIQNGEGRTGFMHDVAYILDVMLTLNAEAPPTDFGNYKLFCDFGDITANPEEEKAFDYQLTQAGYMAKWRFLVKHCGLTEEEAKQMVAEAQEESAQNMAAMSAGGLFAEE